MKHTTSHLSAPAGHRGDPFPLPSLAGMRAWLPACIELCAALAWWG